MSSTNQSVDQQPEAVELPPDYQVGTRCPQCQLGNKVTHLIAKGQKLICPACWWNTKNRNYTKPSGTICANANCVRYDEEAEKSMQWCCKSCEPMAVDDLPRQIQQRSTSVEKWPDSSGISQEFQDAEDNRTYAEHERKAGRQDCLTGTGMFQPAITGYLAPSGWTKKQHDGYMAYYNSCLGTDNVPNTPEHWWKLVSDEPETGSICAIDGCTRQPLPGLEVCHEHIDDGEGLLLDRLQETEAIVCPQCKAHNAVVIRKDIGAQMCKACGWETAYQAPGHPPQMDIGNGRTTKCPDYHLIPEIALQRIAERFELGEVRKGDKAWNAGSPYQDVLEEKRFILARLSHVISHTLAMMKEVYTDTLDEDDNAGAIGWAGCFLICVREKMKERHASGKTTVPIQPAASPAGNADKTIVESILETWLKTVRSGGSSVSPDQRSAADLLLRTRFGHSSTSDQSVPSVT